MKLILLFDPRYTLTVHIVQVILILLVLILSIVRVSMTEIPITRANIMSIPIVCHHPRPRLANSTGPKLTIVDIEHQVTRYPCIPTPDGAQRTFPKVGKPKGKHVSQHVGGPLLGCFDGLGIPGQYEDMRRRELCGYMGHRCPLPCSPVWSTSLNYRIGSDNGPLYRFLGMQAAVVSTLDWKHFRRHHYPRGSVAPLERDYENGHRMYGNPSKP